MDANNERYFFVSGLISISLFVGLVMLAGFSLFLSPKTEQFAMIQSNVINISIATDEPSVSKESVPEHQSEPVAEPLIEEKPNVAESVPDISDLFSQVPSEKTAKKRPDDLKRNEQLNALEKEVLQRKETSRFSDKVNNLTLAKPSIKMIAQGASTGPVVNEYHAKIQGLVYTYFRPPNDSIGQSARISMVISASGKLISYKILRYGSINSFNHEVDWLKDRLNGVRFPEHPEGKDAVLEFILTAKEQ